MTTKKTTDSWLSDLDPVLHGFAETIRKIIFEAAPDISEAIKWGNPT